MAEVKKEMVLLASILKNEHMWYDDIMSGFTFENKEKPCPTKVIELIFERLYNGMESLKTTGTTDQLFNDFDDEEEILEEVNDPKKSAIEYLHKTIVNFHFLLNEIDEYYYNMIMPTNTSYNSWSSSTWGSTPVIAMVNIYKDEWNYLSELHHYGNKLVKLGEEIFKECLPEIIDNKELTEQQRIKEIKSQYGFIKQSLTHILMYMELIRNNVCKSVNFINNQYDDPNQYSEEED